MTTKARIAQIKGYNEVQFGPINTPRNTLVRLSADWSDFGGRPDLSTFWTVFKAGEKEVTEVFDGDRSVVFEIDEVGFYTVALELYDNTENPPVSVDAVSMVVRPQSHESDLEITAVPLTVRGTNTWIFNILVASTFERITDVVWNFGDGSPGVVGLDTVHEFPEPTTVETKYTVTATVTHPGTVKSAQFEVVVPAAEIEAVPVPKANGPWEGTVGDVIAFDARGSHVKNGTVARVEWDIDGEIITDRWYLTRTFAKPLADSAVLTVFSVEGPQDSVTYPLVIKEAVPVFDVPIQDFAKINHLYTLDIPHTECHPQIVFGALKNLNFGAVDRNVAIKRRAVFDGGSQKLFNEDLWKEAQDYAATTLDANGDRNFLRYARRCASAEYQGYNDASIAGGPQFFRTGPVTFCGLEVGYPNGTVFAGHWLTGPYHVLSVDLNASQMVAAIDDGTEYLEPNSWCIIYTPGYQDAEFVKLGAKSAGKVDLAHRGFKSEVHFHPAGSRIAMLTLHQGASVGSEGWLRNMSTVCPQDGDGRTWGEAIAHWRVNNYNRTGNNSIRIADVAVHGACDDSDWIVAPDRGSLEPMRRLSCRNLPASKGADYGFADNGTNLWGEGVTAHWELMRILFSERGMDQNLVGGDAKTRVRVGAGSELESLPNFAYTDSRPGKPDLAQYAYAMVKADAEGPYGPTLGFPFMKTPADIMKEETHLALGIAAMVGCPAGFVNQDNSYPWPEYGAVYTSGPKYGQVVPPNSYDEVLANKHWLGEALGPAVRDANPEDFTLAKNYFPDPFCENSPDKWTASGATIVFDQTGLGTSPGHTYRVTPNVNSPLSVTGCYAASPAIPIAGGWTTMILRLWSQEIRRASFAIGDLPRYNGLLLNPGMNHFVLTWNQQATTNARFELFVGQGHSSVWIDTIMLFDTYSGIVRREFERGLVVTKLDNGPSRVISLGATWQTLQSSRLGDTGELTTLGRMPAGPTSRFFIRPQS